MPPQLGGRCGRTPRWSDRPGPRAKRVDDVIARKRIVNVIRPAAAVHHRDSSVASAVPSVSSQWCRSRGRPTNADTSLALPITQRSSLPQIGAPRFKLGTNTHRPGRSNSARFPVAGQAGRIRWTRRKRSSICPSIAGRLQHVCTEVPPRSITIAISCPPVSPENEHLLGLCCLWCTGFRTYQAALLPAR